MASLNKVMIIGNVGRDAELRYSANGTAMSDFSVAVNYRRRSRDSGDWEDATEWFNVILFRDQAERISQWITKGKQIYVEGRLQTRNWDDDQGNRHYRTEVIANNVEFLGRRSDYEGGGGRGGDDWGGGGGGGGGSRGAAPNDLDDLPFE